MPDDDVVVESRVTEYLPTPQPPGPWSPPTPLVDLTEAAVAEACTAVVGLLGIVDPVNNTESVVIQRNCVVQGIPVRQVEYRVSAGSAGG
jgi:hypothetical protein